MESVPCSYWSASLDTSLYDSRGIKPSAVALSDAHFHVVCSCHKRNRDNSLFCNIYFRIKNEKQLTIPIKAQLPKRGSAGLSSFGLFKSFPFPARTLCKCYNYDIQYKSYIIYILYDINFSLDFMEQQKLLLVDAVFKEILRLQLYNII